LENLRFSPTLPGEAPPPSEGRSFTQPKTFICFSHLRWGFVFQRPQHLMSRLAKMGRVIFWEEPEVGDLGAPPGLSLRTCPASGVLIATPRTPKDLEGEALDQVLRDLLDGLLKTAEGDLVRWYYTPMMLGFSRHLSAACTVYDCMDELANFRFAPTDLLERERELFSLADVVFTGGYSLYEAKRDRHGNIKPFPSSVDRSHFARARAEASPPR
jgi:UDP-galactopyranose mutase